MSKCRNLPKKIEISDCSDEAHYREALYNVFSEIRKRPLSFLGMDVKIHEKRFIHLITCDHNENKLDTERASRLSWIGYVLTNCSACNSMLVWHDEYSENKIKVLCTKSSYIIILMKGEDGCYYLSTAYNLYGNKLDKNKTLYNRSKKKIK